MGKKQLVIITMSSSPNKQSQWHLIYRFYCNECRRPMCVVCVTLDGKHQSQHCEMPDEIRRRQNELQNMQTELKKSNHNDVYHSLQKLVGSMEKVRNETRELIQQQIGEMVKVLQEKEAKFLEEVEAQHQQQVKDVERRLKDVEGLVKRMASSEQLVEKMQLYASDQVVLEMHPHIKKSLEELRDNQPPVVHFQIQARDFAEVKTQLQALYERVTKAREAVPGGLETAPNQVRADFAYIGTGEQALLQMLLDSSSHQSQQAWPMAKDDGSCCPTNSGGLQVPPSLVFIMN
nr:protein PML-like [Zootoca vivipara]